MIKELQSPKSEVAESINNIMKLCSSYLEGQHLEITTKTFAINVLSTAGDAGQALSSIVETTGEAKDAISKYTKRCGLAEQSGDDILVAIHEDHMELMNAAMKLCSASGTLSETIRQNAVNGMTLIPQESKQQIGDVAQALCMICNKLEIPLVEAIASNYRLNSAKNPKSFE